MTLKDVVAMDAADVLVSKRAEFVLPADTIYLDGNSLGCLPLAAKLRAYQVVEQQWGQDLIKSWNVHHWIDLPVSCGEKIARLIGAGPGQVICCDSISVNLFKLLSAAVMMQKGRSIVVSQQGNFPTDLYMVQGLQDLLGADLCRLQSVEDQHLEDSLTEDVAVLLLSHVNFRSGLVYDMHRLTQLAHAKGIVVIWDLAHSAGVLPVQLDACDVDFAVGCGYKYLNGGPGAPAFMYVATRHQDTIRQPLTGWMGHKTPFEFDAKYVAADGMARFLAGTPPVLSMSVLDAALDVFADVDMCQIREKSLALSRLFMRLVAESSALGEVVLDSPADDNQRGSQLAYRHPEAYAICQAMIARGIIGDFRAPDIFRVGFNPLYLSFQDIYSSVRVLADVVASQAWREPRYRQRSRVT